MAEIINFLGLPETRTLKRIKRVNGSPDAVGLSAALEFLELAHEEIELTQRKTVALSHTTTKKTK